MLVALVATSGIAQGSDRQAPVRVIAPDSARSAALLREVFAGAYELRIGDSTHGIEIPRGTRLTRSLVVIGAPLTITGAVSGDVVVIGADVFIHPGGSVQGRVVAIDGGAYPSLLASVGGPTFSFRDETYDREGEAPSLTLRYRALRDTRSAVALPLLAGLRVPTYDRVDGLSLPWGPLLLPTRNLEIEPLVTYRSDLGNIDPTVDVRWRIGAADSVRVHIGRETATNDRWMRGDLLNGPLALWSGDDERNYYRRDVAFLELSRAWTRGALEVQGILGGQAERAWSVGPDSIDGSAPWSLMNPHNVEEGMERPNPPVTKGTITSALVGARVAWRAEDLQLRLDVRAETPFAAFEGARFVQVTTSFAVAFPTFGLQRFATRIHSIVTGPDAAPRQRWGYLGGPATLPTIEPTLAFGGDQLLFIESDYDIPIQRFQVPLLGSPVVSLVSIIGGAGEHRLPSLSQNIGVRGSLGLIRITGVIDPKTRRKVTSFGLSLVP